MPWEDTTVRDLREEFVRLAESGAVNLSELCRRFRISRKTGYKWIDRYRTDGVAALENRSCRPRHSPTQTTAEIEAQVVELRAKHPAWGARKIAHVLQRDRQIKLATSTANSILHRHGLIKPEASAAAKAWHRFEHDAPNDLWQMDFKGHFPVADLRCHPLTVIDDHSRYNLVLQATQSETFEFVQGALQRAFEQYGLPWRINTDNGAPWRAPGLEGFTRLGVWLIRLGIRLSHSRPGHPQTNGKDERFHKSLKAESITPYPFRDMAHAQAAFDEWRQLYNHVRPHESLAMKTPAERYQPSRRCMPTTLDPIEYGPDDLVRKVQAGGWIDFKGHQIRVFESLRGQPIALRPQADCSNSFDLYFCHQKFGTLDMTQI